MPIGSFDLDNSQPPRASDALQIGVYRYDRENTEQPFALLPNIQCLRIDTREGPDPPVARFEYLMDDSLALAFGWPSQFEQLWPIDAQGPYVAKADDRLVVMGQNPDGSNLILFDGFAQIPQVDVNPSQQRVSFTAVGVAARAFDDVIIGRVQRDANTPDDTSGDSDVVTDLPCRFNPADTSVGSLGGILGNSTPNANFTVDSGNATFPGGTGLGDFPVFVDPLLTEREVADSEAPNDLVTPWHVSDAVKYLLSQPNPGDDYLSWPTFSGLDALLNAQYPPQGSDTFNPNSTVKANVMIRDYDATGKPLPQVIADLVGYCGFLLTWMTAADGDGLPKTWLKFYRRDPANTAAPKLVYLDQARNTVDPAKDNLSQLHLARDCNSIANAWQVETQLKQVEVCVSLAPLYQPQAGDEQAPARDAFKLANLTNASTTVRRKYRWYGGDETGVGHWNSEGDEWSVVPLDLSPVFPADEDGTRSYVRRYRPGDHALISRDPQGRPLKATLEIYASTTTPTTNADPYIEEDQSALTWLTIPNGWRLLEDRLGIEVTASDPEHWSTGNPKLPDIRGITWWANPPSGAPNNGLPPVLRLTTVIDSDIRLPITANKRKASPTRFTRARLADAKDHFQYGAVSKGSPYYPQQSWPDPNNPGVIRDDTSLAQTHANQLRAAHEFPPLAGSLSIPFVTAYYEIGDRIREIAGRNVNLQTNIAGDQGEAPTYPWVVGVSWDFTGARQQTILELTDRRAEVRKQW